jgi:hypothetical protein
MFLTFFLVFFVAMLFNFLSSPWDRTTVRLPNVYSLLNPCERATAWGLHPGSFFLVQHRAKPLAVVAFAATFDVFSWRQVTVFDSFLRFFLCHFILLSCFGLAFRELSS